MHFCYYKLYLNITTPTLGSKIGDFPVIHSEIGIYGLLLTGDIGGVSLKLFKVVTFVFSGTSSVISTSGGQFPINYNII